MGVGKESEEEWLVRWRRLVSEGRDNDLVGNLLGRPGIKHGCPLPSGSVSASLASQRRRGVERDRIWSKA